MVGYKEGEGVMTTNGLSGMRNVWTAGREEARLEVLIKRWHKKIAKNKALLSTVSILPLAACGGGSGGGSDGYVFRSDLTVDEAIALSAAGVIRPNGYSIKDTSSSISDADALNNTDVDAVLAGATQIGLSSGAAIPVEESNALALLNNFIGFEGVVTLSEAGTIEEVGARVDTYVLYSLGSNIVNF